MMTKQEIYDKVCAHLAQQKTRSMKDGACAYRGDDGKMCAVGCLIPARMYRKRMEKDEDGMPGCPVNQLFRLFPAVESLLGSEHIDLLTELQDNHDFKPSPTDPIQPRLVRIAKRNGITPGAEQAITEWN